MKFIGKTLNYIINTNEELGMFTEKIICDILKLKFNSKRKYMDADNYPFKLRQDLEMSLGSYLKSLRIKEHLGHQNTFVDFMTYNKKSISIKTNISGNKICPQTIGQVSLEKLNEKTEFKFNSVADYKKNILKNPNKIVGTYVKHLFCCDQMLSFKYDEAKMYSFERTGEITLQNSKFRFSKTLQTWQNSGSMSMSIEIGGEFRPLCEFQVHTSRNCIKCRFNLDTVISLIEHGIIENVTMKELGLKHKYQIRVVRDDVPVIATKPKAVPIVKKRKIRHDDNDDDEFVVKRRR